MLRATAPPNLGLKNIPTSPRKKESQREREGETSPAQPLEPGLPRSQEEQQQAAVRGPGVPGPKRNTLRWEGRSCGGIVPQGQRLGSGNQQA